MPTRSPPGPCYMCYMCYISPEHPLSPASLLYVLYLKPGSLLYVLYPLNIHSPRVPCYMKNLDLDLFREKLLDKLGADWGRPPPELLQAQTTAEEAKAKHQARQAKGALKTKIFSAWPSEVRVAIETGVFETLAHPLQHAGEE